MELLILHESSDCSPRVLVDFFRYCHEWDVSKALPASGLNKWTFRCLYRFYKRHGTFSLNSHWISRNLERVCFCIEYPFIHYASPAVLHLPASVCILKNLSAHTLMIARHHILPRRGSTTCTSAAQQRQNSPAYPASDRHPPS